MSPEYIQALMAGANVQAPTTGTAQRTAQGFAPAQPQGKKKRNFWLDQLSTGASIAGGIGGSLVAPIAGTAAGAAIGGGLGEAIENIIDPQGGNWGNVGKEAALSGIMGAGPIKLLKGAGAGTKALMTGADDVVGAASKAATTSLIGKSARNTASKVAQGSLADAWGTKAGRKLGGDILTPQEARKINQFISKDLQVGKGATAFDVLEKATSVADDTGKTIGELIKANNRTLTTTERRGLYKSLKDEFGKIAGVDYTKNPRAMQLLDQARTTKTLDDLHALRKSLDDGINFGRNSNTADPIWEQLAKPARKNINTIIDDAIPDLAPHNKIYGNARRVQEVVAGAAEKPRGVNIFNNRIGGGLTQKVKSGIGSTAQGMGAGGVGNTGIVGRAGIGARLGITGMMSGAPTQQPSSLEDALMQEDQSWPNNTTTMTNAMNPNASNASSDMMDELSQTSQDSSSPFSPNNVNANIQQILSNGGDLKDVKEYIGIVQAVQGLQPKDASSKPLSQGQQERADLIKALGLAEQTVEGGSINYGPVGSRLEGVKSMFNKADPETLNFKNTVSGLRAAITKARAGASLTAGELKMLAKYTPSDTDSEQQVRSKLAGLRQLYGYEAPAGGNTLEDALMQYSGQGYQ